jgi:hypothetical protein
MCRLQDLQLGLESDSPAAREQNDFEQQKHQVML